MPGVTKVIFSPLWPEKLLQRRRRIGIVKIDNDGREKRCPKCKEFWPADTEFFQSQKSSRDGLHKWCKPCINAWRKNRRMEKEKDYAGINAPHR